MSQTPDWRSSALVAVHELIEALLCKHAGITTEQVDQFDLNWKPHMDVKTGLLIEEPGNDREAPYYKEHFFATSVEMALCRQLELDWVNHEAMITSLG